MSEKARPDPRVARAFHDLPEDARRVGERLLAVVRANAGGLTETLKWGNPTWVGTGNALCIMVYPRHVNLGLFQGVALAPRFPRIEGTGKSLRHVKVRSIEEVEDPGLARIIRAAVQLDQDRAKAP